MSTDKEKKYDTPEEFLHEIMKTYGDDVLRLAYVYVKDMELAKDMSQDVFVKCFEKYHEFRHESSYKTWVLRIAANHCKDYLRSGYYKYIRVQKFASKLIKSKDKTPEEAFLLQSQMDEITECVLRLPRKYREVIILFYFQDLSIKEIGSLLEKNENTIKTRLRTARNLFGKLYKTNEGSDEYGGSIK
jgi:RNA polymerase sigma-70 factor, ECF subfamily